MVAPVGQEREDGAGARKDRARSGGRSPDGLASVAEAIALLERRHGSAATVRALLLKRLTELSENPRAAKLASRPWPRTLSKSTYQRAATAYRTGRPVNPLLVLALFKQLEVGFLETRFQGGKPWVDPDLLKALRRYANTPVPSASSEVTAEGAKSSRGGWTPGRQLAEASRGALRDAEQLDKNRAITLGEVYVPRGCEPQLARRLLDGLTAREGPYTPQVIVGEAGTGKTSLLWKIAELTRQPTDRTGRARGPLPRPTLIRGEDLFGSGAAGSEHAHPLDQLKQSLHQPKARAALIVLLDTADILLHDADSTSRCKELLDLCRVHRVPLAVTCRVREQEPLVELLGGEAYERTTLGDFRPGAEARRAVTAYCDRYYRGRSQHERDTVREEILEAAVRGLPIREVVGRALTLRMLFEVYAPDSADAAPIPTREIDSDSVYDLFWERRVERDVRHGGSRIADKADLAPAAEALARQMLHDGKAHVVLRSRVGAADAVAEEETTATAALTSLDGRGVLTGVRSRTGIVRFFHQTLYEYAAGHCLATLAERHGAKYYDMVEDWLTAHPEDFLRAVVAERSIVLGVRSRGPARGPALGLLRRLARSEDNYVRTIALRAYAFLPAVFHGVERDLRELLGAVPDPMVTEFVGLLPTRRHLNPKRVTDDLEAVLRRSSKGMQRPVLESLCRFVNTGEDAAFAVQNLLDGMCQKPDVCIGYRVAALEERTEEGTDEQADGGAGGGWRGCGSATCLWSWLLVRNNQEITDHGNQAVRLVDAIAEHLPGWAAVLMEQQIQLARRRGHPRWLLQCVESIDRHKDADGWGLLLARAAKTAEQLGDPDAVRQRLRPASLGRRDGSEGGTEAASDDDFAEEQREGKAMRILARHWARTTDKDLTPAQLLRTLAGTGHTPYSGAWLPLRAQLTALGWMMRTKDTGVADFLQEAVDSCRATAKLGQVARAVLPQLFQASGAPGGPGTQAAQDWCARQLRLLKETPPGSPVPPSVQFCAHGLSGLPPRTVRVVAEAAWGRAGRPWSDRTTDHVFLNEDGASALCVPLAAAGYGRAAKALERWRALEIDRTAQLARGANGWPGFLTTVDNPQGLPWHGKPRTRLVGRLHRALVEHAPHAHHLAGDMTTRVPLADMTWLTELARKAANHPTAAVDGELFSARGPELAAWCQEVWKLDRYPQYDIKHQALQLWRNLVWLRATPRPGLPEQAALLDAFRTIRERRAGLEMLLGWNRQGVSELAGANGEDGWAAVVEGLDAMIHDLCTDLPRPALRPAPRALSQPAPQAAVLSAAIELRRLVLYRFAALADPADRSRIVRDAEHQTEMAERAKELTSVGFLIRRLTEVDRPHAVRLFVRVTDAAVRVSAWSPGNSNGVGAKGDGSHGEGDGADGLGAGDSHDVESLAHHWRSAVYELVRTTDHDQFRQLITGLAGGPQKALAWAVDAGVMHRRDEDTQADLTQWLAASPYRDEVDSRLRSAAVRYRRTPLNDLVWADILT